MMRWITIYFVLLCLCSVRGHKLDSSIEPTQQCSWRQPNDDSENRYLSCLIKTISGLEGLIRNLTATNQIGSNQVVSSLRLECSDVFFAESSLGVVDERRQDFSAFNEQLQELAVHYCKIKYVPASTFKSLRNLKSLTLQTHNADWSTINLELHPETFTGLSELKRLNLADNNIWNIPSSVFCPLYSLKNLNLSKNHINDISQIGFAESIEANVDAKDLFTSASPSAKACNTGLEQLDLSFNNLISIPNNCFTALRSLNFLHLDSNRKLLLKVMQLLFDLASMCKY